MLEVWLEGLAMHISVGHTLPVDLLFDIENYKGVKSNDSSLTSTPDGLRTPPSAKKNAPENPAFSSISEIEVDKTKSPTMKLEDMQGLPNSEMQEIVIAKPQELSKENECVLDNFFRSPNNIPRSPHLSKDFSPTGERIRSSIRARRQQRLLKNQEKSLESGKEETHFLVMRDINTNEVLSEPTSLTEVDKNSGTASVLKSVSKVLAGEQSHKNDVTESCNNLCNEKSQTYVKKSKPYGEKGYIINYRNGDLNVNNVKNLDVYSDLDSSCDTSLNYIDSTIPDNVEVQNIQNIPQSSALTKTNASSVWCNSNDLKIDVPDSRKSVVNNDKDNDGEHNVSHRDSCGSNSVMCEVKEKSPIVETTNSTLKSPYDEFKAKLEIYKKHIENSKNKTTTNYPLIRSNNRNPNMFNKINNLNKLFDSNNKSKDMPVSPQNYNLHNSTKTKTKSKQMNNEDNPNGTKHYLGYEPPLIERIPGNAVQPTVIKRCDSNEHISNYYQRSLARNSQTEKIFTFRQKISPTSDLKPNYSFDKNKLKVLKSTKLVTRPQPSSSSTSGAPIGLPSGSASATTSPAMSAIHHTVLPTDDDKHVTPLRQRFGGPNSNKYTFPRNFRNVDRYDKNNCSDVSSIPPKDSPEKMYQNKTDKFRNTISVTNNPYNKVKNTIPILTPENVFKLNAKYTETKRLSSRSNNGNNSPNDLSSNLIDRKLTPNRYKHNTLAEKDRSPKMKSFALESTVL